MKSILDRDLDLILPFGTPPFPFPLEEDARELGTTLLLALCLTTLLLDGDSLDWSFL